ncbi:hypothetical protein BdWA1_002770 [Babesia duncani]|uniref:Uncharacterized protein n=1 Tax=Babesia duncani TaxID=323732 RepID=A0AAD9PK49_9APIC|nr:hypothetical protein BdWA1_002770 [Babesia duncani]
MRQTLRMRIFISFLSMIIPSSMVVCGPCLNLLIRHSYISDVLIFYGRYGKNGLYRLFKGRVHNIEMLYYGHQCLFPYEDSDLFSKGILVETFNDHDESYVLISIFSSVKNTINFFERRCYALRDGFMVPFEYSNLIPRPEFVRVGLDVNPDAPLHPFIGLYSKNCQENGGYYYEMKDSYHEMDINPPLVPIIKGYILGIVYDSSRQALIGYTLFWYMAEFAIHVQYFQHSSSFYLIITEWRNQTLKYFTNETSEPPVWVMFKTKVKYVKNTDKLIALSLADRLHPILSQGWILLDVAQNATPEYFNILAISGTVGDWEYFYYESNKSVGNFRGIYVIIDSSADHIAIWERPGIYSDIDTYVEVYDNKTTFVGYVIINYAENNRSKIVKQIVFERTKCGSQKRYLRNIYETFPFLPNTIIHNQLILPYIYSISVDREMIRFIIYTGFMETEQEMVDYITQLFPKDILLQRPGRPDYYYQIKGEGEASSLFD